MATLRFIQANLQHSVGGSAALLNRFAQESLHIALVNEPWVNKGVKGLNHPSANIICDRTVSNPRAAILIRKELRYLPMNNHISNDLVAVLLSVEIDERKQDIVIASAYFPGDGSDPPPIAVRNLISFCTQQELQYIIGCDANSHHSSWGSTNTNKRGESLYDYLLDTDAIVLNEGDDPTFFANGREEVLDITFCSARTSVLVEKWHVSPEPSLSDHFHIKFDLRGQSGGVPSKRNPRKTDWKLFTDIIQTVCPMWLPTIKRAGSWRKVQIT